MEQTQDISHKGNGKASGWTPEARAKLSESMKSAHAAKTRIGARRKRAKRVKAVEAAPKTGRRSWRLSDARIRRIQRLAKDGVPREEIARRAKVAYSTVYRYLSNSTRAQKQHNGTAEADENWTVPLRVLSWFRDAYNDGYARVRAGDEFTSAEHKWMIGYSEVKERRK